MKKIILHLCADTGSDTKPYDDDPDYTVIKVGSDIGVENFHPPQGVWGIIANPVCLEFSTARKGGKARNPDEGMFLVKECIRIIREVQEFQVTNDLKFWVIENPATGALRHRLGKPRLTYQPWEYGSPWTKKTSLWGEFNIPAKKFDKWSDVPQIDGLYIRKNSHNREVRVPKPSLAFMHKGHKKFIREFDVFDNIDSDMEFRSLCSQKFARAFKDANP